MSKARFLRYLIVLISVPAFCSAKFFPESNPAAYKSEKLEIRKVSDHVYRHISVLKSKDFGNVPCNGMIVAKNHEAIIFDTPAGDSASLELIRWVENNLKAGIKAVIPTHFHEDCLGGLEVFHQNNIPSYAHVRTIKLAEQNHKTVPQNGFESTLELRCGKTKVLAAFLGEGHTEDNIIGYFPEEKVLFGGCLIKEIGAGKGNLEDARTKEWPETVKMLKRKYPEIKTVIPGHGEPGSKELLDNTIRLFEE